MTQTHFRRPHPSADDVLLFEQFVEAVDHYVRRMRAHRDAGERQPSADPMLKARKACRERVMPRSQQVRGSPLLRLLTSAELVGPMTLEQRVEGVEALGEQLDQVKAALGQQGGEDGTDPD